MSYYLLDHPPATEQFYPSRPRPLTGGVLIHTTESPAQPVGADRGALSVAEFISRRSDYGSYHCIIDSGSTVQMMPASYVAYHCAASGYNGVTWGISFACRTTDLDPEGAWTKLAMKQAAAAIVDFWRSNGFDPVAAAQMIPAIETQSRPGMTTHGDAQPADRSDAWTRHPRRAELEALLLAEIAAITNPQPKGLRKMQVIAIDTPDNIWWVTNGIEKRQLRPGADGVAQAKELAAKGLVVNKVTADGSVVPEYMPQTLRGAKAV